MEERAGEIAKIQTAVWLSEKLARLCRECLKAERAGNYTEYARIRAEMDTLVKSRDFSDAVNLVGRDLFYPDTLRKILAVLLKGQAADIAEAIHEIG